MVTNTSNLSPQQIETLLAQIKTMDRYYLLEVRRENRTYSVELTARSGKKVVMKNFVFYDIHSLHDRQFWTDAEYRRSINTLSFDEFDIGFFVNEEAGIVRVFQKPLTLQEATAANVINLTV